MNQRNPRAALVTLATGNYKELLKFTGPTLESYARKWGWDYLPFTESMDESRPDAWSKIRIIASGLAKFDYIIYVDSDAVILPDVPNMLHDLPLDAEFAWVTNPINKIQTPNAGVMIVRNTESCRQLMDLAYEQTDLIYDAWWDQIALMRVLGYEDPRPTRKGKISGQKKLVDTKVFHLKSEWNVTSQEVGIGSIYVRHFAGDLFLIKKLFALDYLSRYFSSKQLSDLGLSEELLRLEYNDCRKIFFDMQLGKVEKIKRSLLYICNRFGLAEIKYK
jgi:hypothetical protein